MEPGAIEADILVESELWQKEPAAEAAIRRALSALEGHLPASIGPAEVAIVLTDDSNIQTLNRDWRGFDKPTNVLSFPAAPLPACVADGGPRMLGDIAIAFETLAREAAAENKPFADHLSHLAIHGVLHLVGHDHETDAEAEIMEQVEREALQTLGIADPYAGHDDD